MTIKRLFVWGVIVIVSVSAAACDKYREMKIDRILKAYDGNVPGASLLVIKNGQPVLKKSYGLASLEDTIPVSATTDFRLASFTKQFTAMCIMQLKEAGKLNYDEKLTDIFSDFPAYGNQISIRNLLTHTSGLIDYESLIPDSATYQVLDKDVLEMMKKQDSTYFTPGLKYRYSNTGYAVLAMIVEKVSGLSFPDYLQKNIFGPLGMTNSLAYVKGGPEVPNRAWGYAEEKGNFVFKDQSPTSAVLGDGGIYTNVDDMFKWDQALYTDKLVSFQTLDEAWKPGKPPETSDNTYGFGWRIDKFHGHLRIHHNGSTCGFRNCIQRFPSDHLTVVLLTNRAEPNVFPLAEQIANIFLEDEQYE